MKRLILALGFALAACGQTATPPTESAPRAAAPAPSITGTFTAVSTTAMSITGDLDVTADVLSFGRGFRIEGARVDAALGPTSELAAGQGSFADATGNQSIETMELRQIALVRVAADAAAPQLCGDQTPTFVVLARGGDALSVLVFSGIEPPGAGAAATSLCGIFNFVPG
ncbi:hypothetical protein [Vitreimonas flagellata]|uniref:hypothetical protein n=1 Tax=Vitreimonas flagellata TaxID=2560861 RepID=UPI001074BD45|nr:hypothetical protein [Vitreimonas flagellata]